MPASNPYSRYIRSKAWRVKRRDFINWCEKTDNYRCWRCSQDFPFYQVHHLSYQNLGKETFSDFQLLCWACHKKEHSHLKISKTSAKRLQRDWVRKTENKIKEAESACAELDEQYRNAIASD